MELNEPIQSKPKAAPTRSVKPAAAAASRDLSSAPRKPAAVQPAAAPAAPREQGDKAASASDEWSEF